MQQQQKCKVTHWYLQSRRDGCQDGGSVRWGGHRRGRRANVGLSDLGCQGSVPGWGVLGKGGGRGEKRRIPGEGQGSGLSAGTQSLGTPLLPAAATPGTAGRGAPAPGTGDPPDPLVPVLTGHRPGGDGSGALLLPDRAAAGPLASAAAVTASTLRPRPLRPAPHELRVPAPTCPLGGEPRARAPSRGWWGARVTPSRGWGGRPRRMPRRAPGEPAQQSPSGHKNSASPGLPCAARSWQPNQSARGAGPGLAKEAGKARDWVAASGRSLGRTCGSD